MEEVVCPVYYPQLHIRETQQSSIDRIKQSVGIFLDGMQQLTNVLGEDCELLLRQLETMLRKELRQLKQFATILADVIVESFEANLETWNTEMFVLLSVSCQGVVKRLQEVRVDAEGQALTSQVLNCIGQYCSELRQCQYEQQTRTDEERLHLWNKRKEALHCQKCVLVSIFQRDTKKYQEEGISENDQIREQNAILNRVNHTLLKMDISAFWDNPTELIRVMRQHNCTEQCVNTAICPIWQLKELNKLSFHHREEKPDNPRLLFLKICIEKIQQRRWNDEPLIGNMTHWFYVLLYLADRHLLACNDYEGFCQLLRECGVDHLPTTSVLSTESHAFQGGRFPQWKFARPMSTAARRKMEIGQQMNLIYKEFHYLLK